MYHPGCPWNHTANAPAVIMQAPGMHPVAPGMPHPVHHSHSYTYGVHPPVIPATPESYIVPPVIPPPAIPSRDSYVIPHQHDYNRPRPGDIDPALDSEARHYAFDLRLQPTDSMLRRLMSRQRTHGPPAMLYDKDPQFVSFICRHFPWRINLHRSARVGHAALSVVDVWNILWSELHQPLNDTEWGFIRMTGSSKWEEVEKAAIARRKLEGKPKEGGRIRRVDVLGSKCIFLGLELDEDFARRRILPGESARPETWIIKLGTR